MTHMLRGIVSCPKPAAKKKAKRRGGIKRTPADAAFSDCIREKAKWKCERCGKQYHPPTSALQCSHFIGRGSWAVRFCTINGDSLCYGCHSYFEGNPVAYREWKIQKIGQPMFDLLIDISHDIELSKRAHREQTEIAKYYRAEFSMMHNHGYNDLQDWASTTAKWRDRTWSIPTQHLPEAQREVAQ